MFFSTKIGVFPDGEREPALLPSIGGVVPSYRLSGAPADPDVRNLITTESSLAYRFHQAAPARVLCPACRGSRILDAFVSQQETRPAAASARGAAVSIASRPAAASARGAAVSIASRHA